MEQFYIGQTFEKPAPPEAAAWCNAHNAHIEKVNGVRTIVENPAPEVTAADYDKLLEEHIYLARAARGYTTREPSYYLQSSVPRWKQDAHDWVDFIDRCMLYGLEVQNRYAAGEEVPSLEEFKANLPQINWTYKEA